jgi:hypothetical protein
LRCGSSANASRLWGNPNHLDNIAKALRNKYGEDELRILVATTNSNFYTYDGIDVGGERCAKEIEDELERLEARGRKIEKLSMVGYSLGGLIARYCVGLLEKRLELRNVELVNFITFATPHLGVRAPRRGYRSSMWNAVAARTLSKSGHQLFLIDSFRDLGRPLLGILADPGSIFVRALSRFKNRVLYANTVNDRLSPWYTTAISRTDPFQDIDHLEVHYLPKYTPIIIDTSRPITRVEVEKQSLYTRLVISTSSFLTRLPLLAFATLAAPIGSTMFLINAGIQTFRSGRRLQLHEAGKAGVFNHYRIPFMIEARNAVEGVIGGLNAAEAPEYLSDSEESSSQSENGDSPTATPNSEKKSFLAAKGRGGPKHPETPVLALTDEQLKIVDGLDGVGFKKFPVYIHDCRHSHAAMIVRSNKPKFDEGYVVLKHWVDEVFQI